MGVEARLRMLDEGLWRVALDPGNSDEERLSKLADTMRMFLRELLMGKGSWLYMKDRTDGFVVELLEDPEHYHLIHDNHFNEQGAWLSTCRLVKVLFRVPDNIREKLNTSIRQSNRYLSEEEAKLFPPAYRASLRRAAAIGAAAGGQVKRQRQQ
eukprot:TRINITY_DN17474_c0_g1_i4.p1 TRINITY_DN17474_c0_g1~~TRINITY_DN17474_c0_g1_i4.p1  ORF type:complete len:154 (+),score=36.38 TRINITY_DN17474_c0_g1_i4:626-1087(+)